MSGSAADLDLDDDDALAVHADALARTDEARAELIAVQIELARAGIGGVEDLVDADISDEAVARAAALLRRANVLLAQHRARWEADLLGPDAVADRHVTFVRGLPYRIEVRTPTAAMVDRLAAALAATPSIKALRITGTIALSRLLTDARAMRGLRELSILLHADSGPLDAARAEATAHARFTASPPESLSKMSISPGMFAACTDLRSLRVGTLTRRDIAALLALPFAPTLAALHVIDRTRVAAAFDGSFPSLASITLDHVGLDASQLGHVPPPRIAIANDRGGVTALAELVGRPAMARVRSIAIGGGTRVDVGAFVRALAASPHLGALEELALGDLAHGNGAAIVLDDAANAALASLRAPRLARLTIASSMLEPRTAGALAANLPLRSLVLGGAASPMAAIVAAAPALRRLHVARSPVTDGELAALLGSPIARTLRSLRLFDTDLIRGGAVPATLVDLDVSGTLVRDLGHPAPDLVRVRATPSSTPPAAPLGEGLVLDPAAIARFTVYLARECTAEELWSFDGLPTVAPGIVFAQITSSAISPRDRALADALGIADLPFTASLRYRLVDRDLADDAMVEAVQAFAARLGGIAYDEHRARVLA